MSSMANADKGTNENNFVDGDIVEITKDCVTFYGISIGYDTVAYVSAETQMPNTKYFSNIFNLKPIKRIVNLDTLNDLYKSGFTCRKKNDLYPRFGLLRRSPDTETVVERAITEVGHFTSLDSKDFALYCRYGSNTKFYLLSLTIAILATLLCRQETQDAVLLFVQEYHLIILALFYIPLIICLVIWVLIIYYNNEQKLICKEKESMRETLIDNTKSAEENAKDNKEPYNNFQMESNIGLHRYIASCQRNPGHRDISVKDFTLQHLPEGLRDKDLYELIQVVATLTIRVSIQRVRYNRPQFFPNPFYYKAGIRNLRTGSGEIFALFHYVNGHTCDVNPNILIPQINFRDETYKPCTCHRCQYSDSPSNEWYEIFATTSIVNVFDETEARHTTCRLFYDVDDSPVVLLDKVSIVMTDVRTDFCVIKCVTCDKALGEKLQEMCERKKVLMEQILKKYKNTTDKLCFIVSHPHGCPKHVTIGQWVDNEKLSDFNENIDLTRLTYTTATCPGSIGASVHCVGMKHAHIYSGYLELAELGTNYSGIGYYYKS